MPLKVETSTTEFNGKLQEMLNGKDDICFAFMGNVYRLIIVNHGGYINCGADKCGYPNKSISRRTVYFGKEPIPFYGMKELYPIRFYDLYTYRLCLIELINNVKSIVVKEWMEESPENYYA